MQKLWDNFISSFDTHTDGFSGRKLTAFGVMLMAVYLHRYANYENVIQFIIVDYCCVALCLGLVTGEQLVKMRSGTTISETKTLEETKSTTIK